MDRTEEAVRGWIAAWDTPDAEARLALLRRAVTEDAAIAYPTVQCTGWDAVSDLIGGIHRGRPGVRVVQRSGIEAHHGWLRVGWRIAAADGATLLDGLDVVEVASDGRLCRVVGFHDPLPPLG
jgi:hypothetical protein